MDSVLIITQIVALVCFSVLSIIFILVLLRFKVMLVGLEEILREFTNKTVPVLENLEAITARLKAISENIDDQVMAVRDSFTAIRSVADNVLDLERQIQERVEGPILETVALIAAVVKGLRTFFARVRA
ncbi:MAG: hypothetical protein KAJ12_04065 [Bacteroidetes bacterium]|nr:hypothetical protein [Bacteroidota bacterium]